MSSSERPSGQVSRKATFFSVSLPCHGRSARGATWFACSTSVSIVAAPGVRIALGAGVELASTGAGGVIDTASTLAA